MDIQRSAGFMVFGIGIICALELFLVSWLFFRWKRLRAGNATLQSVIDSSTAVSIIATDADGVITLFNAGAERMLGYAASEMVGIHTPASFHLASEAEARGKELSEEYGRPIEGFEVFTVKARDTGAEEREWTFVRKDGSHFNVSLAVTVLKNRKGDVTGMLGIATDITERIRTERALAESDASLRRRHEVFDALMENLPMGVLMVEAPGGKPIVANPAAIRLLGMADLPDVSRETIGETYRARKAGSPVPYPPDEMPILRAMRGESSHIDDLVVERPDGGETRVEVFGSPIRNERGEVWASLVSFHDITARKRAEEELAREKAFSEAIFNSVPGLLYLYDFDGHLIRWNRKHETMTGYSSAELSRMRLLDWYKGDEKSQNAVLEGIKKTSTSGFGEAEANLRRKDGSTIPMYFTASPMTLFGKGYFVGVGIDVSARKRTERLIQIRLELLDYAATHTLEELLRKALDEVSALSGSPIGFYHFVDESQKSLTLQTWSTRTLEEFCRLEGRGMHYPVDEAGVWVDCIRRKEPVIHNDYASLAHRKGLPEGHAPVIRDLTVPVMEGDRIVAILGVGNKPKEYTDEDVQIVSFLAGVSWEIVSRKMTGDALRESQAKLTALFDSMAEMVALHELTFDESGTPVNYRIVDCNDAYTRITGIAREDAVGRLATEVYGTPEPPYLDAYARVAVTGEPCRYETYFPPMEKHFAVSAVSPAKNAFATITTDITEAKRIESAIAAKNEELEQIVYVASHDLRSPLVNVDGYSRELEYSLADIKAALAADPEGNLAESLRSGLPDMEKSIRRVRTSAGQMDKLLKGLLHLSRQGRAALQIEDVDMDKCLAQTASSFEYVLREQGIALTVEPLPPCRGDAVQLTQVFSNLIGNAIKYRDPARPCEIRIRGSVSADRATYRVEDNGIGIAENHLDHVFELFHRLDPEKSEGEGLGLTIARQALSRMYGEIRAESESGKGSAFIVDMPPARGKPGNGETKKIKA